MSSAGPAERARALAELRRFDEAAALLVDQASRGDPEAQFTLALWRIDGSILRRDLEASRTWLGRAAGAGHVAAASIHAGFLAAGVGGEADWPAARRQMEAIAATDRRAAEQLRILDGLRLDENGLPERPATASPLSESPRVSVARRFASPAECDYLLALGEPELSPSVVVDPASGRLVPHPIRTSEGTFFGVVKEDLVVNALNRRIAAISGTDQAQGESLQLLRYRAGMEYRPHLDTLPAEPNQRILTALVYLTGDYDGGETCFVASGMSFKGGKGDVLLFSNVLADGRPDPASRHAGLPVRRGVKAVASRWIRAKPFAYPPPRPATGDRFG